MSRRRRLRIVGRWLREIADMLDPRPYYTLQVATLGRTDTFVNCVPHFDPAEIGMTTSDPDGW